VLQFAITPKAFANSSPGLERSENPGDYQEEFLNPERVRQEMNPFRVCRKNRNSQKTGNEKSFVVIEKLVTRQMCARNFLTISPTVFFRQTLSGLNRYFDFIPRVLAVLEPWGLSRRIS
jgi:hypothetical protein